MHLVKPTELHQMDLVTQLQEVATEQPIELHQMDLVTQLQEVVTGGTRRLKLLVILKKGFNMKPFLFK